MERRHGDAAVGGVVVGVDGSPGAAVALDWALAKESLGRPVRPVLAYQVDALGDGTGSPTLAAELAPLLKEEAEARMAAALDGHPELAETAVVTRGNAGRILVEASTDANLLVVGTRGRSALVETLFGSVGSHCVKHAKVPVAVITPDTAPTAGLDEILVGADGSLQSLAAVRWAVANVAPGGRVRVVGCWVPSGLGAEAVSFTGLERAAEQSVATALAAAEEAVAKRAAAETDQAWTPPSIEGTTEYGDARRVLADLAQEADLLVIGARGHRGVPYLLLGSVATSLLHHPTTATVVVP